MPQSHRTPGAPSTGRETIWFEIAAMLCVAVVPFLLRALVPLWDNEHPVRPPAKSTGYIIMSLAYGAMIIVPALWIMRRSGVSAQRFGLCRWTWFKDPALILATIVLYFLTMWGGALLVYLLELAVPGFGALIQRAERPPGAALQSMPIPRGGADWIISVLSLMLFALIEELVCRAYLINRFRDAGLPAIAAILLSAFLFASYHLYMGLRAAICVFVFGVAMGGLFLLSRRIVPLAIGHTAINAMIAVYYTSGSGGPI